MFLNVKWKVCVDVVMCFVLGVLLVLFLSLSDCLKSIVILELCISFNVIRNVC